jgi:hypothetical protein
MLFLARALFATHIACCSPKRAFEVLTAIQRGRISIAIISPYMLRIFLGTDYCKPVSFGL